MKIYVINIERKITCLFTYIVPELFKHSYIL
jgi:hypothetical protein